MYTFRFPVAFHPVDMLIVRRFKGRLQFLLGQKVKDAEGGENIWRFPGGFIDPWDSCAEETALREAIEETSMRFSSNYVYALKSSFDNSLFWKDVDFVVSRNSGLPDVYSFEDYFAIKKPLIDRVNQSIAAFATTSEPAKLKEEISSLITELQKIKLTDKALLWLRNHISYIGSTKIDDSRYRNSDHKVITSFYLMEPIPGFDHTGDGPFDDIARTKWFYLSDIKDLRELYQTPKHELTDKEKQRNTIHPAHLVLLDMLVNKFEDEIVADEILEKAHDFSTKTEEAFNAMQKEISSISDEIKAKIPHVEKVITNAMDSASKSFNELMDSFFGTDKK